MNVLCLFIEHGHARIQTYVFSEMVASMCCDCDELPFPSNYISIINICRRQVSGANGGHIFREYENYIIGF